MRIPSSPHKQYLNGADWCLRALEIGTRIKTGHRLVFAVSVYLEGVPDEQELKRRFVLFCRQFPVLRGRDARCWCLAPYWKYSSSRPPRVPEEIRIGGGVLPDGGTQAEFLDLVGQVVNRYSLTPGWRVGIEFLRTLEGTRSMLLFLFDHGLFDAKGADAFIQLFLQQVNGQQASLSDTELRPRADAQLEGWIRRFKSGQKANRCLLKLMNAQTAYLPLPEGLMTRSIRFQELCFTPEEAKRVQERAFAVAGYLMFAPYALATAASAFYPVFNRPGMESFDYVISTSTDKQRSATRKRHVFFNNLSFLFFQFPLREAARRDSLAERLRDQLVQQARDGLPAAIEEANLLMRILPAKWLWAILMKFYRNRMSSFAFTSLGEPPMTLSEVAGCRVTDCIHFPVIPAPPGLGLILCQHEGKLHAVLSYFDGVISDEEAKGILARFRTQLLSEHRK
jgi:hypothetical protein